LAALSPSDVQAAVEPEAVKVGRWQRVALQLFDDKADLFVIHNMGQSCPYCRTSSRLENAPDNLAVAQHIVVIVPSTPPMDD
jgi:hypothetical protein